MSLVEVHVFLLDYRLLVHHWVAHDRCEDVLGFEGLLLFRVTVRLLVVNCLARNKWSDTIRESITYWALEIKVLYKFW